MRRYGLRFGVGVVAVGLLLVLVEWSEQRRERRHAQRPEPVVTQMLDLAQVAPNDVVYDLECGDGQTVVSAAKAGARAWCFDIYPRRLAEARDRARRAQVDDRITFRLQHWDTVDVSPATVVVVWLTNPTGHSSSYSLRGQLTRELAPGARIVAYRPDLGDWVPTASRPINAGSNEPIRSVTLWVADGTVRPWLE